MVKIQLLEQLKKAFGATPSSVLPSTRNVKSRVADLLALVQRDDLSQLGREGTDREIARLSALMGQDDPATTPVYPPKNRSGQDLFETDGRLRGTGLASFAAEVRWGVARLMDSGEWSVIAPRDLTRVVTGGGLLGLPASFYLRSGSFFGMALWRAQELIGGELGNIRKCQFQKCGKLYLSIHGKRYCSKQCAQNERARRFKTNLTPEEQREHNRLNRIRKLPRKKADAFLAKLEAREPAQATALRSLREKTTPRV